MPDRVFIDTNILVYFVSDEREKRKLSENIIFSNSMKIISTQVINEFLNVSYKKNMSSDDELISLINDFINNFIKRFYSLVKIMIFFCWPICGPHEWIS